MILISLGPAGKFLAYNLHMLGYRCFDVGHLSTEYKWMILETQHKISEVTLKENLTQSDLRQYYKQVIGNVNSI